MIAQPLVVEHQLPDFDWKLFTLPLALLTAGLFALSFRSRRLYGHDRVGCSAQLVCRHMGDCDSLPGSVGCIFCSVWYSLGRSIRDKGGLVGLAHRNLATNPGMVLFNCASRTIIA